MVNSGSRAAWEAPLKNGNKEQTRKETPEVRLNNKILGDISIFSYLTNFFLRRGIYPLGATG
jgi:hypothetical protein